MTESVSWIRAMDPRETKLNILLIAIPATVYFNYVEHNYSMAFFSSLAAIMPLAFLMGRATEEIALRTSESLGGLLNATFGNAAELIIAALLISASIRNKTKRNYWIGHALWSSNYVELFASLYS